jgi:hypothetical protein
MEHAAREGDFCPLCDETFVICAARAKQGDSRKTAIGLLTLALAAATPAVSTPFDAPGRALLPLVSFSKRDGILFDRESG